MLFKFSVFEILRSSFLDIKSAPSSYNLICQTLQFPSRSHSVTAEPQLLKANKNPKYLRSDKISKCRLQSFHKYNDSSIFHICLFLIGRYHISHATKLREHFVNLTISERRSNGQVIPLGKEHRYFE